MATTKKRLGFWATTGIEPSQYGTENPVLRVHSDAGSPQNPAGGRRIAAATYRAAAAVEDAMDGISNCAVGIDVRAGRLHLEFAERASEAEQKAARAVLDAVAVQLCLKGGS